MPVSILECVPNVSEGQDRRAVDRMSEAIRRVSGVRLVDVHMDPDHHRSVFTFLGSPTGVEAAALAFAAEVFALIDMERHRGLHPRMGALDVLPFVPLRDATMTDAAAVARRVGEALARAHDVPVYFYGAAAAAASRRVLIDVRRGEYEGLPRKLRDPAWRPDAGPARFNSRAGAVAVGARDVLVAYNVWLDSYDLEAAQSVARAVRESSGGLPALQAMGGRLTRRGLTQVAMNLVDYRRTSIPRAFDAVRSEAARLGVAVRRGELVGLAPRAAFEGRSPESVGLVDFAPDRYLDSHLPG